MADETGLSLNSEAPEPNAGFQMQASGQMPKEPAQVHEEPIEDNSGDQGQTARSYADKFESPEDLEKGYLELQKKLGEMSAPPKFSQMDIDTLLGEIGVDNEELVRSWQGDGRLTDDMYQRFAKAGISKDLVNQYMTGQTAIAQNSVYAQAKMLEHAQKMAGGPEEWEGLKRWAATNLPEERLDQLNTRLADPQNYEGALKELLFDYRLAVGKSGSDSQAMLAGNAMPNTTAGFESSTEMMAELRRVRAQGYTDAAFKARMANTPKHIIQGIDK
jgi:hypothetical protein